jgi:drug/metabolite transporter (DMT)-like permease
MGPYLALVLVQIFFGLWPTAGTAAMTVLSPAAVIGWRTMLGAPMVFGASRLSGDPRPSRRDLAMLALLAVLGISANQLIFTEGLHRAGPINAVVLLTVIPAMSLTIAVLLRREKATLRRVLGLVVTLAGVWILVRAERFDLSDRRLAGDLLLLTSCSLYSTFLVLAKPVVSRVGPLNATGWLFLFGAIEALPWTAPAVAAASWSSLGGGVWFSLAFILIGPTIAAYFLNAYALARIDSSVVALFVGLQPLVGTLATWTFLGTEITLRTALAGVVIVCGVLTATLKRAT